MEFFQAAFFLFYNLEKEFKKIFKLILFVELKLKKGNSEIPWN